MVGLEDLPAPLPLYCLYQLPDLKALDSARRSCSVFSAVFRLHAVELFGHIAARTLMNDLVIQIRFFILLTEHGLRNGTQKSNIQTLYENALRPMSATVPHEAVSYAMRGFSYLAAVCNLVLYHKLQLLQPMQMQHLKERTFAYRDPIAHLQTPEGVSYKLPALSPPSWVEQQRVMSALWRLQVRNKLELAQIPGNHESDPWQSDLYPWQSDLDVEMDLSLKNIGASFQHADHIHPPSWEALDTPPRLEVDSSAGDIAWRNTWEKASRTASSRSSAYTYFHVVCRPRPYSPLQDSDWTVLRRLGLAIWAPRRLTEELELANFPRAIRPPSVGQAYRIGVDDYLSESDLLFTWRTLYSISERVEAECQDSRRDCRRDPPQPGPQFVAD